MNKAMKKGDPGAVVENITYKVDSALTSQNFAVQSAYNLDSEIVANHTYIVFNVDTPILSTGSDFYTKLNFLYNGANGNPPLLTLPWRAIFSQCATTANAAWETDGSSINTAICPCINFICKQNYKDS